jgi:AraC-like DNA-binding protein
VATQPALARWELVPGAPAARLRGAVLAYTGYAERSAAPLARLEAATARIPVILSLGPSILVGGIRHTSFVAGLDPGPTVTRHAGEQLGIQLDLTPLGARRLLGVPMGELAGRVVPVEDLLGRQGSLVLERLREAPGWAERFALLDRVLGARLAAAAPVAPELEQAWARLHAAGGVVAVEALAREVGWSRRHLAARFRQEIGLPPKVVARILRFERVADALRAGGELRLAEAAYACGYADQAHLNRDFRAFSGLTPTAYAARLLPDAGGVAGDAGASSVERVPGAA